MTLGELAKIRYTLRSESIPNFLSMTIDECQKWVENNHAGILRTYYLEEVTEGKTTLDFRLWLVKLKL